MGKSTILNIIKKNRGQSVELPEIPNFSSNLSDVNSRFINSVEKAGGETILAKNMALQSLIDKYYPDIKNIVSLHKGYRGTIKIEDLSYPHDLKDIELAVIEGCFGVAENGAIWVEDKDMAFRALPFITENLIIVLRKNELLANMHEAYNRFKDNINGFGVFISGPSKTADIEQSLVIGAHGAKSLYVYLV